MRYNSRVSNAKDEGSSFSSKENADDSASRRYRSIDVAKGLCILFVIITHYAWQDSERLKYLFPFWIDMAVPVFMIISGFVCAKSFQKKRISSVGEAYEYRSIFGKVIRFTVPFVIAFLFEELVFTLLGVVHHNISQAFVSFLNGGFGHGSYYYPIMVQFIFYFPIIFFIIRKYNFKGLILCFFINLIYEILKSSYGMNEECYRLLLFRYTLPIAYGCFLATGVYGRRKILSALSFIAGLLYIICFKYMGLTPIITKYWTGTSMWACLFVIPISSNLILNNAKSRFLEALGKASYDIFLVQMVYFNGVAFLYPHIGSRLLQLLVNGIICVLVGLIFYHVETPLAKKIGRLELNIFGRYKKRLLKYLINSFLCFGWSES